MRKRWLAALPFLAACTPADVEYCNRYGEREGTESFGRCIRYFHQQQAAFAQDRSFCDTQADGTYPRELYDHGQRGYARVMGSDGFFRTVVIDRPPDYQKNQLVDNLRLSIVTPCMAQKGWASPLTWQAGRTAPVAVQNAAPLTPAQPQKLPWQN